MFRKKFDTGRWFVWLPLLLAYVGGAAALGRLFAYSWSGFLLLGVAPVLLFDRFTFRLLAPGEFDSRGVQLAIRGAYFLLGSIGFLLYYDGQVTGLEAQYLGVIVSLAAFLMEFLLEWGYWLFSLVRRGEGDLKVRPLGVAALGVVVALPMVALHPLLIVHPVRRVATATPAHLGLTFQTITFRAADGVRLQGWFVPAEDPVGTAVYCHGYGENRGQVLLLLDELNKMHINVLAFDFRGHGKSEGHTVTFGHREVQDVQAAVAEAKARGGDAPVFLIGVSYGAGVALQSLRDMEGIAGVWVDSTFANLNDVIGRNFGFLHADVRRPLVSVVNAVVRVDCGFWPGRVSPVDSLRGIKVPIFFCHSRRDAGTPFEEGRKVYEAYRGPKGHYWVDDDGPRALSDVARQEYFRRMKAFFERSLDMYGDRESQAALPASERK